MSSLFAEQQPDYRTSNQSERRESAGKRRSSVDIRGHSVTSDILVALLDRPQEMRMLASRNLHFYEALENYITETQGIDAWVRFQEVAYAPREDLSDRDWIAAITQFLKKNPVFLTKFKESVGYYDDDDDEVRSDYSEEEDEIATSSGGEDQFHTLLEERGAPEHREGNEFDEDFPPPRRKSSQLMHPSLVVGQRSPTKRGSSGRRRSSARKSSYLSPHEEEEKHDHPQQQGPILLTLREYPDIQERLNLMCPAYFHKVRQRMACPPASKLSSVARRNSILDDNTILEEMNESGAEEARFSFCDQEESFEHFKDVVCTTRRDQPDDQAWLHSVVESLDGYPELLEDLKEIAASLSN
ncbi:hypothetical protein BDC45DRAFT_514059 [Circinella umbellata]|nr:hypothetical protein BDC45DRAFT_514059 [Circinella umbellata]